MECIKIKNLNFSYPNNTEFSLADINIYVRTGEFLLLCGVSGCGKTTLLKLLKREISPHGAVSGEIYINGTQQRQLSDREAASTVGYILQNPEQQIVTDRVWHELSFGMENLGYSRDVIKRRVAEIVSFFGLEGIYHSKTSELSGGEKQLVNLASIIAMNPKILVLDEPTAQLDPIAAHSFIDTVSRLNREWGLTVIISEHRTEEIFPIADRVIIMENGRIIADSFPGNVIKYVDNPNISLGFPTSVRLYSELSKEICNCNAADCPLTVKQARQFITDNFIIEKTQCEIEDVACSKDKAVELKNVSFRYSSDGRDIANGLNLTVHTGEVYSL
ncbi:MAG: ABC transporter ATP-binding protein, partial [Lachnospiraceae bacterium]|nr:ABC transporter ATP-binding protein [Lachnospiraceae bacterium]